MKVAKFEAFASVGGDSQYLRLTLHDGKVWTSGLLPSARFACLMAILSGMDDVYLLQDAKHGWSLSTTAEIPGDADKPSA